MKATKCCLLVLGLLAAAMARATGGAAEELAVWQAMANSIHAENPSKPFRLLYYKTDFASASFVDSAMSDPARVDYRDFCGLSASGARLMVNDLKALSRNSVVFDDSVAEPVGLKISYKKTSRARYIALSRVVFDPSGQSAWLAVDLGSTGAVMRLDKVDGRWNKTYRCGGWLKME